MSEHKSPFAILPAKAICELAPGELRVLAALALFADENRRCFPSQGKIAELLGNRRQYVHRIVKELEKKGYITSRRKFRDTDGGYTSNSYQIIFDQPPMTTTSGQRDDHQECTPPDHQEWSTITDQCNRPVESDQLIKSTQKKVLGGLRRVPRYLGERV